MRKELPALLVLAVSLSACSFSYSSSRSTGKHPGDPSGAHGSGKPAKHAAPAKETASTPTPEPTAKNDAPTPAATPPSDPAPTSGATATLDPKAAKAPAATTATLDPNAGQPATDAGAPKTSPASTTLTAGGKAPPPKSGPTKGPITAK